MKLLFSLPALAVFTSVSAQPVDIASPGLHPSNGRELKKANEVTVVLDPPSSETVKPEPPAETPPLIENPDSLPGAEPPSASEAAPVPAKQGLSVRVEKLQTATGPVDPASVKLLTPFPAKPLSSVPAGWRLDASGSAPPFTREVEITPGSKITLNIRPHLLVPDTDGATTFPVSEPGYDPALGYQQSATVGTILATSIRQLDDDSKHLGQAIDRLQQLLVSLPKPTPAEPSPPPAAPFAKPAKK